MGFVHRKSKHGDVGTEMAGTVSLDEYEAKKGRRYENLYSQKYKCLFFAMVLIFAVTHIAKLSAKYKEARLEKIAEEKRIQEEQKKAETMGVKEHHEEGKSESLKLLEKLRSSVQNDNMADGQHTLLRLINVHTVALPHEETPTHDVNLGKTMEGKEYHELVKNKTLDLLEKLINSISNENIANLEATLEVLKKADVVAHPPKF